MDGGAAEIYPSVLWNICAALTDEELSKFILKMDKKTKCIFYDIITDEETRPAIDFCQYFNEYYKKTMKLFEEFK